MNEHERLAASRSRSPSGSMQSYGSDPDGLICGFLFVGGQAGVAIGLPRALAWLADTASHGQGDFVWLHFNLLRDLAALQERIKLLRDGIAAQVGEHTNSSVFTLTVVTVPALPINLVAGLLGMNVGGIPLAQDPHGVLWVAAIVGGFTGLAGWLAFRRRDRSARCRDSGGLRWASVSHARFPRGVQAQPPGAGEPHESPP